MNLKIVEKELNKLIMCAIAENEVPIAALIVKDNKIISRSYNKVNKTNDILNHAEILAIKKASKKLKNWRLNGCELYVTLEPCAMCKEVINKSRIENVYYFVKQNENKTECESKFNKLDDNNIFSSTLKQFFYRRR